MSQSTAKGKGGLLGFRMWEFDLALRYLRNRRKDGGIAVIAIISFAGIALAVTALISVLSIMNGFRAELMGRMMNINGHAFIYGAPVDDYNARETMLRRVRAVPGVTDASPYIDSPGLAQGRGGSTTLAYMRGMQVDALKSRKIIAENIVAGSFDGFGEGDWGGNNVLIGEGLAETLGIGPGNEITLMSPGGTSAFGAAPNRKAYIVAGVFKTGVSQYDKAFVYMPIEQAQLFFGREDEWDMVEVNVEQPFKIWEYHDALANAAGPGAMIEDWTQRDTAYWSALNVERWAMRFILFFVVIIATLNIISGIVMLVKNKTRDIAILRTMGADRSAVTRIFFISGTLIGVAGTAAGLVMGVLFCTFIRQIQEAIEFIFQTKVFDPEVYYLTYVPARMELGEVAFVAIASLLAACLSTLFPALWASKLEPVEALRYE